MLTTPAALTNFTNASLVQADPIWESFFVTRLGKTLRLRSLQLRFTNKYRNQMRPIIDNFSAREENFCLSLIRAKMPHSSHRI
jgi:hypothetical protein